MSWSEDELPELLADIRIGEQAKAFLATDVGRMVTARCNEQIQEARTMMETCRPDQLVTLQHRASVARAALGWIVELIDAGDAARGEIDYLDAEASHAQPVTGEQ